MPNVATAPQVVADDIDLDDIKVLDAFLKEHPDIADEPRIRWWIFHRKTNGLEASGAIIKRAGRWYVVVPRLRNWLLNDGVDLNVPRRFGAYYTGADGQDHEAIMLHRALFGSVERFVGIYIEHTAGEFPVWVAPVQVVVIPANPKALDYAAETTAQLKAGGVRVEVDLRDEKMGAKIRDAELQKIPYMLVVGPREAEAGTVAPRRKGVGQLEAMTRQAFLERVQRESRERSA